MTPRSRGTALLLAALIAGLPALLPARTIAFQRGDDICTAEEDGTQTRFVCQGVDPSLSPDGTTVAFTKNEGEDRFIALCDLRTGTVRVLNDFGANNYGPRWSADGNYLLFNHFTVDPGSGDCRWKAAVMKADGTAPRLLRGGASDEEYAPSPCGAGRVSFHDLATLSITRLDGSLVGSIPLAQLGADIGFSSATRFVLSPDGKRLLFDADLLSVPPLADGPLSAVFVYDLDKKTTTRVTPKDLCALSPCWLNDDELLFEGYTGTRNLYRIRTDGTGLKKLIKNAARPSCR